MEKLTITSFTKKEYDPEKADVVWHGGNVAEMTLSNGEKIDVVANGDVRLQLNSLDGAYITHHKDKGNSGSFDGFGGRIDSDKDFHASVEGRHPIYEIEIIDSNWLELFHNDADGTYLDNSTLNMMDIAVLDFNSLDDVTQENIQVMIDEFYEE